VDKVSVMATDAQECLFERLTEIFEDQSELEAFCGGGGLALLNKALEGQPFIIQRVGEHKYLVSLIDWGEM
jgi:hypothetical protein